MWLVIVLFACSNAPVTGDSDISADVDSTDVVGGIAVAGSWVDNFGFDHDITETSWESYGSETPVGLTQYDNAGQWTVGQNHPEDQFFPSDWSRFDWTWDADDQLWFCQTVFSANSEEEALAADAADTSDVANSGCGGSAWSQLNSAR